MGEAAEMALDGTACQECGEFFDDVINGALPPGHPRTCAGCRREPEPSEDDA